MCSNCFHYPLKIPPFRQGMMKNLEKKILVDSDRKYYSANNGTVLMTYVPRPSLDCCSTVAKALIHKYSFLKDMAGDGEVC